MALPSTDRPPAGCVSSPATVDTQNGTGAPGDAGSAAAVRTPRKARAARPPKPPSCSPKAGARAGRPRAGTCADTPRTCHTSLLALVRDPDAAVTVDDLVQEVKLLRGAIRRLAEDGDASKTTAEDVKILAELRHQVAALCRTLKAQKELVGKAGDALAAELAQALDALGDGLGVPR